MTKNIVVCDADVLIALYLKNDALHEKIIGYNRKFIKGNMRMIFPNTAIAEAITTLHRKLSSSTAATLLNKHYKEGKFEVEYISEEIMQRAAEFYNPQGSRQNTFFDAIVAATAEYLSADAIFSFDGWYKKLGFQLAMDLS